ncbi:SWPV1-215 [Shearwaterpox virus]|uniref:DNA-directed RNA polymerase 19 kDa subunit n=1 Tax=Shearwaterpox virus TaxID=1974596 RepID=A0A1V0QGY4_CNPV|nr:SWPV1-215 [Shearwaterpox virus]
MDDSIDINGIVLSDDNDYNSYDEDEESLSDINEEASDDCCTAKQTDSRVESFIEEQSEQSPHPKQQNEKTRTVKQRYTRRISLIEMTGILCESYNSLQRGRIPLINDISNETFKKYSLVEVMFMEIEQGNCPIVIQKNGELLSLSDFDQKGVLYHLSYIKDIWKVQHKL